MAPTKREQNQRDVGHRLLAICALVGGFVVLAISFIQGAPKSLPAIALGWPFALYVERAAGLALLIMGVGGTILRLMTGAEVSGAGAPPANITTEDATKPAEALEEAVSPAIRSLNERLEKVEKRIETAGSNG